MKKQNGTGFQQNSTGRNNASDMDLARQMAEANRQRRQSGPGNTASAAADTNTAAKTATKTQDSPFVRGLKDAALSGAKRVGAAAGIYATAPFSLPLLGTRALWQNRAAFGGLKGKLLWGSILGVGLYVGAHAFKDLYDKGTPLTTGFVNNGAYVLQKGSRTAGKFASEAAVPCVDNAGNCAEHIVGNAFVTARDGGLYAGEKYIQHVVKPFYRWHWNLVAKPAQNTFLAPVLPVLHGDTPRSTAAGLNEKLEGMADKVIPAGPNLMTTKVVICKKDYSDNVLRNEDFDDPARQAAGDRNWDLMAAFWSVMNPRANALLRDPKSQLNQALNESKRTGRHVVITFPSIEPYISEYRAAKDAGDIKTIKGFNAVVSSIPQSENGPLTMDIQLVKQGKYEAKCGNNPREWMAFQGRPIEVSVLNFRSFNPELNR